MKLIIGLGNPGDKYKLTRHNAGFLAVDYYLKDKSPIACQSKFKAEICELHYEKTSDGDTANNNGRTKVYFVKPKTFMNLSGEAVQEIAQFYKVNPASDILIIHDDVDLPLGTIRVATDSSAGGHNGVQNIFDLLGTKEIRRVRIGVEARESRNDIPTDTFVLHPFTEDELKQLTEEVLPKVSTEIDSFINS